jgi:uncharacterized protein (UPF0212 family)
MFTTRDLPAAMRADTVDVAILRAVRDSGLRLDQVRCEHGRYDCPTCVVEAARRLVEAAADGEPVG